MIGRIDKYNEKKKYGFIEDDIGTRRFFHRSDLLTRTLPQEGDLATFVPIHQPKGLAATKIRIVSAFGDAAILTEVSKWKIEAKLEDNIRYFYHTKNVGYLESGDKSYVIGRKGTGKTAICEYIHSLIKPNKFSVKLTFKNFPFKDLYSHTNHSFNRPNQYITLWKFVIYSKIAQMMLKNHNISPSALEILDTFYSEDLDKNLDQQISKWTSTSFNLKLFGSGVVIDKKNNSNKSSWINKVESIEAFILNNIDDSQYFILFDELDEDYRSFSSKEEYADYFSLITSLFKAAQDIKYKFSIENLKVFPVIFLRDDIVGRIIDPDKTKWSDLSIELSWSEHLIKKMLAFRISRALSSNNDILEFDDAWLKIFSS